MAKRLYMTSADYLAIAISPALVMALVGSLVYFLIEVLYVGEYQLRLNYAFGLFVFAAVLIARISIEMGSERAALFALALGVSMFLFLLRFVEHPNPFSPLINLALLGVVWWCADRLTWDSTVIDDDQDSSGEGLMQRMGVDGPEATAEEPTTKMAAAGGQENELFGSDAAGRTPQPKRWWRRLIPTQSGPHTPGLWVLYFSLAALPLFGIGQHWIPAADVGRRRYVFFLLLVYVAAALALLVTTSFLGLRRYLRQRHVEMPVPIAATWVCVGAALIAGVMLLAALIPRPAAEIALSRVPWQVGSPDGMTASRTAVNRDGGENEVGQESAANGETTAEDGKAGDQQAKSEEPVDNMASDDAFDDTDRDGGQSGSQSKTDEPSSQQGNEASSGESVESRASSQQGTEDPSAEAGESTELSEAQESKPGEGGEPQSDDSTESTPEAPVTEEQSGVENLTPPESPQPIETLQNVSTSLGGIVGLLKILFYIVVAIAVAYFAWKYWHQLIQALADIWRQLRELFGGKRTDDAPTGEQALAGQARPRSFAEFHDPFADSRHSQVAPEELVRYTFAAFEAWANDHGCPRTPDCTPQELIRAAVDADNEMYNGARRLARLYSELAYASRRIPRESTVELRGLWQLMRDSRPASQ